MAIFGVPLVSLYLVPHAAGGAIVSYAGSYVAGSYVTASVVSAFSTAAAALASVGTSAVAFATSPVTTVVAAAMVVIGGYCYIFGMPVVLQSALHSLGLAAPTNGGIVIPIVQLATALVLIGGAGYLSFQVYKSLRDAREAKLVPIEYSEAKYASCRSFGEAAWFEVGDSIWRGAGVRLEEAGNFAKLKVAQVVSSAASTSASVSQTASQRWRLSRTSVYDAGKRIWSRISLRKP